MAPTPIVFQLPQQSRWQRMKQCIRSFHVEIFVFLFIFSASIEDVTITLLAQDKLCMAKINSAKICANLSTVDTQNEFLSSLKDKILIEVTNFNFIQSTIYTVPLIVTSLFLSSWADRHRHSAKILLCLSSFMFALETIVSLLNAIYFYLDAYLMLIGFIFYPLVGGNQVVGMSAVSYLTGTSNAQQRIKRLAIYEVIVIIANPLGVFLGGVLVRSTNVTSFAAQNGQLHNYHHVLIIAIIAKLFAFFYALLCQFKRRRSPESLPTSPTSPDEKIPLILDRSKRTRMEKISHGCCDMFVLSNVRESFGVCMQKRPGRAHITIWLLLITMTIVTMINRSIATLKFQFVQKVYNWDAGIYSDWNSILFLSAHLFGLLVVTPILTKVLKVTDSILLLIGLISLITQNFVRGTIIQVYAFCGSYFLGSASSVITVAIRSKLSKLVEPTELYRLFGTLAMFETIMPLLGNTIFTPVFNQTITLHPGFVFQMSCLLLLAPLAIAIYVSCQKQVVVAPTVAVTTITTDLNQNIIEEPEYERIA